jgi:hypothetical protein
MIDLVPYDAERHRGGVRGEVLAKNATSRASWMGSILSRQRIRLALAGGFTFTKRRWVASAASSPWSSGIGTASGSCTAWRLTRASNGGGVASALIGRAEGFVRGEGGRGLYADTPVTNEIARGF